MAALLVRVVEIGACGVLFQGVAASPLFLIGLILLKTVCIFNEKIHD
jgi:hypothetical protein